MAARVAVVTEEWVMLSMEESVVIARPPEEVWEYAIDPATRPLWFTNVIEYTPEREGQPEAGDRGRVVVKLAGRRVEFTDQVLEATPGESFTFTSADGPFSYTFAWTFEEEEEEGGTRLTVHGESPGFGGVFGKLGDPLVVRMFSRDMRGNLDNLRTLLESD